MHTHSMHVFLTQSCHTFPTLLPNIAIQAQGLSWPLRKVILKCARRARRRRLQRPRPLGRRHRAALAALRYFRVYFLTPFDSLSSPIRIRGLSSHLWRHSAQSLMLQIIRLQLEEGGAEVLEVELQTPVKNKTERFNLDGSVREIDMDMIGGTATGK